MGSYRASDRHAHHRPHRRLRSLCPCNNSHMGQTTQLLTRRQSCYPAAPQMVPFYQKMFSLYGNTGGTPLGRARVSLRLPMAAWPPAVRRMTETAAPTGRAFRIPATITNRCRPFASITTSTQRTPPGSAFRPTPACKPPTPIPINPLFDAVSPQPLYSFAAGYTHVFSQNLVNYFNPGFSWYESLFAPSDFQKTLAAFPDCVCKALAPTPFTTVGGLDNTWLQGRRASRFFINDNLAWSHGAHEFRFGTNTRILRLNDYDFGEGTRSHGDLRQSAAIHLWSRLHRDARLFPNRANEPFNFLNLDLYAQDTWKLTPKLTWTIGIRDTLNSNPLNPHDEVARLRGSFDFHLPRCQSAVKRRDSDPSRAICLHPPLSPSCSREPPSPGSSRPIPSSAAGFGLFSDILPGSIADVVGVNPPYVQTFQGGIARHRRRHSHCPELCRMRQSPAAPWTQPSPRIRPLARDLPQGELSCASPLANPSACLPPVAITAVPDGKLHAPYFMEWSFGIEHQFGTEHKRARAIRRHARAEPALLDAK